VVAYFNVYCHNYNAYIIIHLYIWHVAGKQLLAPANKQKKKVFNLHWNTKYFIIV